MKSLKDLFSMEKPVIGMIHLSGNMEEDKLKRALEELKIYEEEGVDGAIVEDYHGIPGDVLRVLKASSHMGFKIIRGANVLNNPYSAFEMVYENGGKFVQFDSVQTRDLNLKRYEDLRKQYPDVFVMGGVGFKYIPPTGNPLEVDLFEARARCDAIVTTGDGTGIETPMEKLRNYKKLLGDFPLIVGAGVNLENVREQLSVADGAIIGSYFKICNNTKNLLDRSKVRDIMDVASDFQ